MRKIPNGCASFVLRNFSCCPIWAMKSLYMLWKVKRLRLRMQLKNRNICITVSKNSGHSWTEYWDPGKIGEPENCKNSLNFLHLNISSLPYHFSELETLLSFTKINFDVIGISESWIKQNQNPIDNINLQNYNCTTEAVNGGVLLYSKDDIIYKLRKYLKIYILSQQYVL